MLAAPSLPGNADDQVALRLDRDCPTHLGYSQSTMPSFAIGEGQKRRLVTLALKGASLVTERRRGDKVEKPETEAFETAEEAARELRQRIAALTADGYHEVAEVKIGTPAAHVRLDPEEAQLELEKIIDGARDDDEALAPEKVLDAWRAFGKVPIECQEQAFQLEYSIEEDHVTLDLAVDCWGAAGILRINCELHFPAEDELVELEPESFTVEGSSIEAFLDAVVDTEVWQALSRYQPTEVTVESWRLE